MVLDKNLRKMVYDVYCFMKREADMNAVENLKQRIQRTAAATKVSVSTVKQIVQQAKKSERFIVFKTPAKNKRVKEKPVTDLDNFKRSMIKRIIHNFHLTEKELPTIEKLRKKLQNEINYQGSATSLREILKSMGFIWKKTEKQKKILIERSHIRLERIQYLREIKKYREEGRPIIYTDETYFDCSMLYQRSMTNDSTEEIKKPSYKESLLIVLAGGEAGFVPNVLMTSKSDARTVNKFNLPKYERWLRTKLIPNLPPNSVVVVDNSANHIKKLDAAPTSNSKKKDMQAWLLKKGIEYDEFMLKPELYTLIKNYKEQNQNHSIDAILNEAGHSVLRFPQYHPELKPFEMVWSQIKGHIARKKSSWNLKHLTQLIQEKVNVMGAPEWEIYCNKVKEVEEEYRKSDIVIDAMTDLFFVQVGGDDSDSDVEKFLSDESDDEEMATPITKTEASSELEDDSEEEETPVFILP